MDALTEGPPSRPKRADARRNYDKLVAAAETAFEAEGRDASLDGIARAAGVGPGTLYRRFPSRRALLEAVYAERIAELCLQAEELGRTEPPGDALLEWLRRVALHTQTYTGIKDLLVADEEDGVGQSFDWCHRQMRAACTTLTDAARAAGRVPDGVEPMDLLRLMHGVVLSTESVPRDERAAATGRQLDLAFSFLTR